MELRRIQALALILALAISIGCGGSKPAEQTPGEGSAETQQEAEAVFEEDFEAGDAEEWATTEGPADEGEEEPAPEPDGQ